MNLYRLLCILSIHRRCIKGEKGFTCIDCGFFKCRFEYMADLHSGGGW